MKFQWLFFLFILLSTVSCSILSDQEILQPAPSETELLKGTCGDGICDDAEQQNPSLCPKDCPASSKATSEKDSSQPNIVFLLTDDLDYAAMDYMPHMKTLLADQGTTLTNFLISMPLCCPSRATILRGQYGHNTQIMGNDLPFGGFFKFYQLGEEDSTCATWLEDAGYRTMLAGKYLNAFPTKKY